MPNRQYIDMNGICHTCGSACPSQMLRVIKRLRQQVQDMKRKRGPQRAINERQRQQRRRDAFKAGRTYAEAHMQAHGCVSVTVADGVIQACSRGINTPNQEAPNGD